MQEQIKEFNNEKKSISFEEFIEYEKNNDGYYEYDGKHIIEFSAPSVQHQELSSRLFMLLGNFFKGTKCKVFSAPFPLMFDYKEIGGEGKQKHPDLSVMCDFKYEDVIRGKYYGVPILIIEIVSPNNYEDDFKEKVDIYQKLGVREYIIFNMYLKEVEIYNLDSFELKYKLPIRYKESCVCQSQLFDELQFDLEELFRDIIIDEEDIKKFKSNVIKVNFK